MQGYQNNTCLFSYGTFRKREVQKVIFGDEVQMFDATLRGFEVVQGEDGFFALRENEASFVEGSILVLDRRLLLKADQWEEVPIYEREQVVVHTDFGEARAWVYLKETDSGAKVVHDLERYAEVDETEWLETLHQFDKIRAVDVEPYDIYHVFRISPDEVIPLFMEWPIEEYLLKVMTEKFETASGTYLIASMAVPIIKPEVYQKWLIDHVNHSFVTADISTMKIFLVTETMLPFDKTYFYRRRIAIHKIKQMLEP